MTNERTEKFEKIAERRVTEAIKKLKLIPYRMPMTRILQIKLRKQIISVLESEMKDLRNKFQNDSADGQIEFKFKI